MPDESLQEINKQGISIVISARQEFPQIALTIQSLMHDMDATGIEKYEIILVDNGSEDETSRFFAWKAIEKGRYWKYQYSPRGLVYEGILRIIFDPVMSNVGARNRGVSWSKYENIIFADAHITVKIGTIFSTIKTLNTYGGIIHCPVSWAGSSTKNPSPGYQYSYKVGEKIWGTWNRACPTAGKPFYIPITGHCWLAVKKKEFQEKRGYPLAQRVYGGGEPYLDTKWWMTGSTSMCDPGGLVYHLSAGRNYSWNSSDLIHNMFLVSYILGGKKWADRILITYLNKFGDNETIKRLYEQALAEGEDDKKWLDEHKVIEFEELLALGKPNDCEKCTKRGRPDPHAMRLWDIKNEELHGNHRSFVTEFRLEKRDGKVFIGNTEIIDPKALEIASQYI
jgi:glycosyltransferase involved in cell wall biosynthesis